MTDDSRIERARKYGQNGLVEYLEQRIHLDPRPPTVRAADVTAERVDCGPACVRAAGHTGPHLAPLPPVAPPPVPKSLDARLAEIPPDRRDQGCELVRRAMSGEVAT